MRRFVFVTVMMFVSACALSRPGPMVRDLPDEPTTAAAILTERLNAAVGRMPDVTALEAVLQEQGFEIDAGAADIPLISQDPRRSARVQYRFTVVCGYYATVFWEEEAGVVTMWEATAAQGCL